MAWITTKFPITARTATSMRMGQDQKWILVGEFGQSMLLFLPSFPLTWTAKLVKFFGARYARRTAVLTLSILPGLTGKKERMGKQWSWVFRRSFPMRTRWQFESVRVCTNSFVLYTHDSVGINAPAHVNDLMKVFKRVCGRSLASIGTVLDVIPHMARDSLKDDLSFIYTD